MEKRIHKLSIYTDGSCIGKNRSGGWCFVLTTNERKVPIIKSGSESNTTNNRMELIAVIKALEKLDALKSVTKETNITIYTDSQYVTNMFNKGWISRWKSLNWLSVTKGNLIKNKDLVIKLDELVNNYRDIKFMWVKGHSNNELNNLCDKNAREQAIILDKVK